MAWPQATDFAEAIQNLRVAFRDPDVRIGHAVMNAMGLPMSRTGNFAAVFEVRSPSDAQSWAVKCFTRHVPGLQERYGHIDAHLRGHRLPFMVGFQYLPESVLVRGQWYPFLKMHWVDGLRLDEFLADCLTKPNYKSTLRTLCGMWARMARMLREAEVGHGDLQHGNVMLVPVPGREAYNLKLIDYDGMYVPTLEGNPSGEVGHPAYQHPQRVTQGGYGLEVDRFSHLVIYTTLHCLIVGGRELWGQYYDGDRLLVGPPDLAKPENSLVFKRLWALPDEAARHLVGHLILAAKGPLEDVPPLDQLVIDFNVVGLTKAQQRQIEQLLSPSVYQASQQRRQIVPESAESTAVSGPVEVTCHCGQSFRAAADLLGKQVTCPVCGQLIDIPSSARSASRAPEAEPMASTDDWWAAELPPSTTARVLTSARTLPRATASQRKTQSRRESFSLPSIHVEVLGMSGTRWLTVLGLLLGLVALGYYFIPGTGVRPYYTTKPYDDGVGHVDLGNATKGWIITIHDTSAGAIEERVITQSVRAFGKTKSFETYNECTREGSMGNGDRQVHYETRWTRDEGFVTVKVDGKNVPMAWLDFLE